MSTVESVKNVFVRVLQAHPDEDPTTWKFAELSSWDSLAHMELVGALEDEFGIMLDTDAVIDMNSFDAAVRLVKKAQTSA